ncbi:hypothetical protein ACLOJK_023346 [Asimina triloba]
MASPAYLQTLIAEKKFPFLFALFVLLLCVSLLFVTNTRFSFVSPVDLQRSQQLPQTPPASSSSPSKNANPDREPPAILDAGANEELAAELLSWRICSFVSAVDYIPCLDNWRAIKELKSRRHMEHRERHCPNPTPRCLLPLPQGYKAPVPWPRSRDMIWFDNVPHSKLVEYKKDQNWVQRSGEFLSFPGGGTQFKQGVTNYVEFIEKAKIFLSASQ